MQGLGEILALRATARMVAGMGDWLEEKNDALYTEARTTVNACTPSESDTNVVVDDTQGDPDGGILCIHKVINV